MKSPDKFEYDLWTETKDGHPRYFARVKATGEITELTEEQLSALRSIERQERKAGSTVRGTPANPLSLDAALESEVSDEWLADQSIDVETDAVTKVLEAQFLKTLTDRQRHLFLERKDGTNSLNEYSRETRTNYRAIWEHAKAVERKFKKFMG